MVEGEEDLNLKGRGGDVDAAADHPCGITPMASSTPPRPAWTIHPRDIHVQPVLALGSLKPAGPAAAPNIEKFKI
ncbi:MAG: hypothetical protein QW569_00450 [Candidatus Bathyarchaeia archaeon]|nr:hypothetical protein [Candidatus Bathyarchaeota archaeon]